MNEKEVLTAGYGFILFLFFPAAWILSHRAYELLGFRCEQEIWLQLL